MREGGRESKGASYSPFSVKWVREGGSGGSGILLQKQSFLREGGRGGRVWV